MRTNLIATIGSILISAVSIHEADAKKISLAKDGKALHSVVVSEDAGERVKAAAQTLADYLGRITGGTFVVETGDGASGKRRSSAWQRDPEKFAKQSGCR